MINPKIKEVKSIIDDFHAYHTNSIPLCAAENIISPFCKIPLNGNYQERYIMGGTTNFNIDDNFVGSQYLVPIYSLIEDCCKKLFNVNYVDAKTLSGMNCVSTLLMTLTRQGEKILLLSEDSGGHPSVIEICKRLGLNIGFVPFDYGNYTIDYAKLNAIILKDNPQYICLAPSDIIIPIATERINLQQTVLLYDASQLLGLIAGKMIPNPLENNQNIVLFGGTHKTLPGPTHGLIMTNSKEMAKVLEQTISPKFIRNTQMNQVLSLLFTLIEFEDYGEAYMQTIVQNANKLGEFLEKRLFNVAHINNKYTYTHQLFIKCSKEEMNTIYKNAIFSGVTLNKKERALFGGYGIRLGVQEITRYGWDIGDLETIADILVLLNKHNLNITQFDKYNSKLTNKDINFTYPSSIIKIFTS